MKEIFTTVGLGEILLDILPTGRHLGGAPANFAFHASQLGARSYIVSSIGNDAWGAEISNKITDLGLSSEYISIDEDNPTGTVDVELDKKGKPSYVIRESVAWDNITDSKNLEKLAGRVNAVCFGSLCQRSPVSRKTIQTFLKSTNMNCLRIFDINLRQHFFSKQIIQESLGLSNVLKINDEELPTLAEYESLSGGEHRVIKVLARRYNLLCVALTRGHKGSLLYLKGEISDHPGYPAEVVDSVGAGDAFSAALVIGLLRKQDTERINETANRIASYVCSCAGATPRHMSC